MWNPIISSVAFPVAAKYIHRHMHGRGIPEGKKRNLWVLASRQWRQLIWRNTRVCEDDVYSLGLTLRQRLSS